MAAMIARMTAKYVITDFLLSDSGSKSFKLLQGYLFQLTGYRLLILFEDMKYRIGHLKARSLLFYSAFLLFFNIIILINRVKLYIIMLE